MSKRDFCLRKYVTYNNSIKCKSLLNSNTQCNLFSGLSQPLQWLVKEWTLYLATKGIKVSQTAGHFNELLYQPAQLCTTFRKEHKATKSHNLPQAIILSKGTSREEK